jgi:outer membrane biosynthesis protein TonB
MDKMTAEEKKNNKIGLLTSLGVHAVLLVLFFFLLAWSEPDPPIPQYGIELSFVDSNSKGQVDSEQQQESQQENTEEVQEAIEPEDDVEQATEETPAPTEPEEQPTEVVEETTSAEPVEPETVVTEDPDSPDVVEEEKTEEAEKQQEEPVEQPEKKTEEAKPVQNTTKDEGTSETKQQPTIDSRAIYTGSKGKQNKQSSSGGASLDLSGWIWDFEPEPNDKSDESGKVVFEIIVDNEGEIIGVKTLEKTVSPAVERVYKEAVMDLTFSKTAENRSVAPTSTGKITFIIQAK